MIEFTPANLTQIQADAYGAQTESLILGHGSRSPTRILTIFAAVLR
jgi:hypothetical protein